ncbi:MAG: heme A synthase [Thermomicrobiales bacterium]
MRTFIKRLTVAAAIGMFIVLIQGSLVTTTGSEEGCGKSWPLCHGEFVPSYALETMIEFSHRFVVGIETFLIVGAGIGAWIFWRGRKEIKAFAPVMVGFLVIQALLGAAAVMWPQTPEILALHFGVSLIAFASVLLTALFIHEQGSWDRLRDRPLPRYFRTAVFALLGYTYLVVYWGAYVRHKEASMACTDWPLCNGEVVPILDGPIGIVFGHRVSALVLVLGVVGLTLMASRARSSRPDLFWGSMLLTGLVIIQSLSGAIVVWTRLDVFATLSHGMFASLYFGTLCYLALHSLPRQRDADAYVPLFEESTSKETGRVGAPATS